MTSRHRPVIFNNYPYLLFKKLTTQSLQCKHFPHDTPHHHKNAHCYTFLDSHTNLQLSYHYCDGRIIIHIGFPLRSEHFPLHSRQPFLWRGSFFFNNLLIVFSSTAPKNHHCRAESIFFTDVYSLRDFIFGNIPYHSHHLDQLASIFMSADVLFPDSAAYAQHLGKHCDPKIWNNTCSFEIINPGISHM